MTKNRRLKKGESKAGGRSGVIISNEENEDDVDKWFDTARSPDGLGLGAVVTKAAAAVAAPIHPPSLVVENHRNTRAMAKRVKTPENQVSMRLPGSSDGDDYEGGKKGEMVDTKATEYAKKLRRKKGGYGLDFTSPSDLSRVSTAAQSPDDEWRKHSLEDTKIDDKKEQEQEQEQEFKSPYRLEDDNVDDSTGNETEDVMLTQEGIDDAGIPPPLENDNYNEGGNDAFIASQRRSPVTKEKAKNIEHPSPEVEILSPTSPATGDGVSGGDQSEREIEGRRREEEEIPAIPPVADDQAGDEKEGEEDLDDLGPPVLPDDDYPEDDDNDENDNDKESGNSSETNAAKENRNKNDDDDDNKNDSVDVNMNDYEQDDDVESSRSNMALIHDPETPETIREVRAKREKQKFRKNKEGEKISKKTESENDDDDVDDVNKQDIDSKFTPKLKKTKKHTKRKKRTVIFSPKGMPIGNRDYETVPIGALVESSPDEAGPRRSKRAKVKPLEFWRGEKMEYGAHNEDGYMGEIFGNMPVVTGIQKALPTPYKKRKIMKRSNVLKRNGRKKSRLCDDDEDEFDSKKLRRRYKYLDGEEAYLWDDSTDDTADQKVVAYASKMEGSDLPISKKRRKSEGKVTGRAAQAFNIPNDEKDNYVGYIMGNLILPPKGIKDSESVGPCAQTFTVCHCQSKALEVAYGDPDEPDGLLDIETAQRFLLGPGDMFRVPPGNCYRLENHSIQTECLLTWTIIRPRSVSS